MNLFKARPPPPGLAQRGRKKTWFEGSLFMLPEQPLKDRSLSPSPPVFTSMSERAAHTNLPVLMSITFLPSAVISEVSSFSEVSVLNKEIESNFSARYLWQFRSLSPITGKETLTSLQGHWVSGSWVHMAREQPHHCGATFLSTVATSSSSTYLIPAYISFIWPPHGYLPLLCQPPKCCPRPHVTREKDSFGGDHWFTYTLKDRLLDLTAPVTRWIQHWQTSEVTRDPPVSKSLWQQYLTAKPGLHHLIYNSIIEGGEAA